MIGNNYVLVAYSEKYGSIKGVPFEVVETPEFSISDALVEYEAGEFQVSIAVENADTENVLFAAAAYDEHGRMIYVTSVTVPVVNGVASTSELASEEPIEGVAVLKAFAWDAAAQKPAANPKGFELTVDA